MVKRGEFRKLSWDSPACDTDWGESRVGGGRNVMSIFLCVCCRTLILSPCSALSLIRTLVLGVTQGRDKKSETVSPALDVGFLVRLKYLGPLIQEERGTGSMFFE